MNASAHEGLDSGHIDRGDDPHENQGGARNRFISWCAITGFFLLSGLVFAMHQIDFGLAAAHGLSVPDSVNMTRTLQALWTEGGTLDHKSGLLAVAALYGWTWLVHPALCFAVNLALMLANASLFRRIVVVRLGAPAWSVLGLLANPYLMLVMPGPNKEIPLLLLTLCLADVMFRTNPRWWTAIGICFSMYFFRDGYGLIMLLLVSLKRILGAHDRLLPVIVLIMTVIAAALWAPLSSLIPAMARNMSIYIALSKQQETVGAMATALMLDPFDPLGGFLLYGFRLAYNLVSLAFFPVFLTEEGHIFWIGVAYWIYGLMCLMAWIGCALGWLSMSGLSRAQQLATSLALGAWFMISLSLFVQPRYLMPMLPIAFCAMAALPSRLRAGSIMLAIGLVLTVMSAYAVMGRSPPPANSDMVAPPAYVW